MDIIFAYGFIVTYGDMVTGLIPTMEACEAMMHLEDNVIGGRGAAVDALFAPTDTRLAGDGADADIALWCFERIRMACGQSLAQRRADR